MRTTARRAIAPWAAVSRTGWTRTVAVLAAAALATTVPDLARARLGLGPWPTALVAALFLLAVAVTRRVLGAGPVLDSWAARVLALTLGAAFAEGLSRGPGDGGLGLGPGWTALILLAAVAAVAPLASA
jgi:uncharacterized membrane-anchored protein